MSDCHDSEPREMPPPTLRDMERILTVGYACECGCGRHFRPTSLRVEGPPMLGSRGDVPHE